MSLLYPPNLPSNRGPHLRKTAIENVRHLISSYEDKRKVLEQRLSNEFQPKSMESVITEMEIKGSNQNSFHDNESSVGSSLKGIPKKEVTSRNDKLPTPSPRQKSRYSSLSSDSSVEESFNDSFVNMCEVRVLEDEKSVETFEESENEKFRNPTKEKVSSVKTSKEGWKLCESESKSLPTTQNLPTNDFLRVKEKWQRNDSSTRSSEGPSLYFTRGQNAALANVPTGVVSMKSHNKSLEQKTSFPPQNKKSAMTVIERTPSPLVINSSRSGPKETFLSKPNMFVECERTPEPTIRALSPPRPPSVRQFTFSPNLMIEKTSRETGKHTKPTSAGYKKDQYSDKGGRKYGKPSPHENPPVIKVFSSEFAPKPSNSSEDLLSMEVIDLPFTSDMSSSTSESPEPPFEMIKPTVAPQAFKGTPQSVKQESSNSTPALRQSLPCPGVSQNLPSEPCQIGSHARHHHHPHSQEREREGSICSNLEHSSQDKMVDQFGNRFPHNECQGHTHITTPQGYSSHTHIQQNVDHDRSHLLPGKENSLEHVTREIGISAQTKLPPIETITIPQELLEPSCQDVFIPILYPIQSSIKMKSQNIFFLPVQTGTFFREHDVHSPFGGSQENEDHLIPIKVVSERDIPIVDPESVPQSEDSSDSESDCSICQHSGHTPVLTRPAYNPLTTMFNFQTGSSTIGDPPMVPSTVTSNQPGTFKQPDVSIDAPIASNEYKPPPLSSNFGADLERLLNELTSMIHPKPLDAVANLPRSSENASVKEIPLTRSFDRELTERKGFTVQSPAQGTSSINIPLHEAAVVAKTAYKVQSARTVEAAPSPMQKAYENTRSGTKTGTSVQKQSQEIVTSPSYPSTNQKTSLPNNSFTRGGSSVGINSQTNSQTLGQKGAMDLGFNHSRRAPSLVKVFESNSSQGKGEVQTGTPRQQNQQETIQVPLNRERPSSRASVRIETASQENMKYSFTRMDQLETMMNSIKVPTPSQTTNKNSGLLTGLPPPGLFPSLTSQTPRTEPKNSSQLVNFTAQPQVTITLNNDRPILSPGMDDEDDAVIKPIPNSVVQSSRIAAAKQKITEKESEVENDGNIGLRISTNALNSMPLPAMSQKVNPPDLDDEDDDVIKAIPNSVVQSGRIAAAKQKITEKESEVENDGNIGLKMPTDALNSMPLPAMSQTDDPQMNPQYFPIVKDTKPGEDFSTVRSTNPPMNRMERPEYFDDRSSSPTPCVRVNYPEMVWSKPDLDTPTVNILSGPAVSAQGRRNVGNYPNGNPSAFNPKPIPAMRRNDNYNYSSSNLPFEPPTNYETDFMPEYVEYFPDQYYGTPANQIRGFGYPNDQMKQTGIPNFNSGDPPSSNVDQSYPSQQYSYNPLGDPVNSPNRSYSMGNELASSNYNPPNGQQVPNELSQPYRNNTLPTSFKTEYRPVTPQFQPVTNDAQEFNSQPFSSPSRGYPNQNMFNPNDLRGSPGNNAYAAIADIPSQNSGQGVPLNGARSAGPANPYFTLPNNTASSRSPEEQAALIRALPKKRASEDQYLDAVPSQRNDWDRRNAIPQRTRMGAENGPTSLMQNSNPMPVPRRSESNSAIPRGTSGSNLRSSTLPAQSASMQALPNSSATTRPLGKSTRPEDSYRPAKYPTQSNSMNQPPVPPKANERIRQSDNIPSMSKQQKMGLNRSENALYNGSNQMSNRAQMPYSNNQPRSSTLANQRPTIPSRQVPRTPEVSRR